MNFLNTLKFQIAAALLLIIALFVAIFSFSLMALEEQRGYNTLLNITSRLEHTAQQLMSLGMSYAMYAPSDDSGDQREARLYYNEIRNQIELFDRITNGFMAREFPGGLTDRGTPFKPRLDPAIHSAVNDLEQAWAGFRRGLQQALEMEGGKPGLAQAARFIADGSQPLAGAIRVLRDRIQLLVNQRLHQTRRLYQVILATVVATTLGILFWFLFAVLRPLNRAVSGFSRVAQGDFGLQVAAGGNNEIAWLTRSFNLLSSRLHAIFNLIDRLQQGSDMEQTLCFVAEQFPTLLPLDWVGALFVSGDGTRITLEHSYREGHPEAILRSRFRLQGTLLERALASGEPLHIPDMMRTAHNNPRFEFLNHLVEQGLRDAIFLPITGQSPIPGVVAFATREPDSYSPEHLELLTNIAHLVTHSFGRTLKLAEHTRLAAIGSFASGIAHEIRSPLSTIGMALEYLQRSGLEPAAVRRLDLAMEETTRITRLLEEILLYAKPLKLELQRFDFIPFLQQFLVDHRAVTDARRQRTEVACETDTGQIMGDRNRLKQVLLNLLNNAAENAPEASVITWRVWTDTRARMLCFSAGNRGEPIPADTLPRLFDPFFTTRAEGTGLGLGIVRRIVEAHGGEIRITSDATQGTRVTVQLPLA
ncbi:MAG TPA: HAMP domain-containing protein [Sedimenticola sp.]|nr:HAMP domain-containing protein [Sedimenticola sp.]